jgi:hypothetical protein
VRQELLGQWYVGIVTSDRAKAYDTRPLRKRQLCWAHLARDVQAMIDRGGPGQAVGEALFPHWYPKLPVSLSSDSGPPRELLPNTHCGEFLPCDAVRPGRRHSC